MDAIKSSSVNRYYNLSVHERSATTKASMKGVPQPKEGEVESCQEEGNKKYSGVHGLQLPHFYRQYTVFMIFITQRCKTSKKNFNNLQTSAEYPGRFRTFVPDTMNPRDMQLRARLFRGDYQG